MSTPAPKSDSVSSDGYMVLWSISAPQKSFLAEMLPDYKAALSKKTLPEFWTTLFEDWFKRWPTNDDGKSLVEEQLKSWMLTNNRWHITTVQRKFLTDRIPDYKAAQARKMLIEFWPFLYMHWFDRWPATEVAPQGLVEKKLRAWFNNNARVTASARQVLNLNKPTKRSRRPALAQTFCKVYWSKPLPNGTVLRNIIADEWVAAWKKSKKFDPDIDVPRVPVSFVNKVSRRVFVKQLPPIHDEIKQHPDQSKREDSPDLEAEDANVKRAMDYQNAIGALPYSLEQALAQIFKQAGMVSVTMVAGPVPDQGGNVVVYSFTHGLTPSGQTFINHSPDFKADFEDKFGAFAKIVFPPAERVKRSLPGSETVRNYAVPAPSAPTVDAAPNGATSKQAPIASSSSTEVEDEANESSESDSESDIEVDLDVVVISPPGEHSRRVSDYERIMEQNIARNAELLKSLGLDKPMFAPRTKKKRASRKPKESGQPSTRRSSRLAGSSNNDGAKIDSTNDDMATPNTIEVDRAVAGNTDRDADADADASSLVEVEVANASEAAAAADGDADGDADTNGEVDADGDADTDADADASTSVEVEVANANEDADADAVADEDEDEDADADADAVADEDEDASASVEVKVANADADEDEDGDTSASVEVKVANANEADTDASASVDVEANASEADAAAAADANGEVDADRAAAGNAGDTDTVDPRVAEAPLWIQKGVTQLNKLSPNAAWKAVITQFINFERSLGFLDGKIVSHILTGGKYRPKEISPWVKGGRDTIPVIKNPAAFGKQWMQWYSDLQPDSRKQDDGTLSRANIKNGDWTELSKGSVNGIYSLVASLGWWLRATEQRHHSMDEVHNAMEDITWVLELMVRGTKRAPTGSADGVRSSKKARVV